LEAELDAHARALHEPQPNVGLAFRDMHALAGTEFQRFPTVRELPGLRATAERMTIRDLDDLGGRVEAEGRRFFQADPVHNPWRRRQPHVQPSAGLRSDVTALLPRLGEPDQRHVEQVDQNGAGRELSADLAAFGELAPELLQRLRPLASARDTS